MESRVRMFPRKVGRTFSRVSGRGDRTDKDLIFGLISSGLMIMVSFMEMGRPGME